MNNQQRGVYQPLMENIPVYDLSEDEPEDEEEERSRLPLLIVVALLVLAAFAGVVWVAYNQGVARGRAGTIIAAPEGPVRTAPTDAGRDTTPFTGLKVYGQPVPPDREAQSSRLAQNQQNQLNGSSAPAARSQAAARTPAPASEAPSIRLNPDAPALASPPAAAQARPAAPAAPPPAAAQARPAAAPPAVPAQTAAQRPASPPTQTAAAAPAVQPGAPQRLTTPPPVPAPAAAAPRPAAPAAPAQVAAAQQRPTAAAAAASGAAVLQIGSFKSEDLANGGWQAFRNRFPTVAGSLSPDIQRADLAGGVFYRLRVGPFADRNAALSACDTLRSQGGTCLIAAP